MHLICVDAERDPRWENLVRRRGGGLFHSPPWLGALADTYGFRPQALVVDADGEARAGVSYCRVRDFSGERIVCAPFSDFCDPLADAEEWRELRGALLRYGLPVSARWRDASDPGGGFTASRRARWHGIDIDAPLDTLWSRIIPAGRRAVRKAGRLDLRVEALDDRHLDDFARLHAALRKRKYRLLAQPRRFFEAIRDRFRPIAGWYPLAVRHRGCIVAVSVYLRWGDRLYYKFNASMPEALWCRPNDLLLWEGVRLARSLGCRELDLGASDDDQPGLIRFKRRYGAREREIRQLRWGDAPSATSAANGTLLGRVSEMLTDPAVPDELTRFAGATWYRYFVA